jgi:hypothetical protein
MRYRLTVSLAVLALVAGCASAPTGPDVMVLPGAGKSFDEFRVDDMVCRDFASRQIGGTAEEDAANNEAIRNAAVGTALGAVAGAIIGGRNSAGVGAGMGMIVGSASGAERTNSRGYGSQRRYDAAYVQCMYAKGHRVPVNGTYSSVTASASRTPPPPPPATSRALPPPPAGSPPPPPSAR